jgi:hypothetical protein
VARRGRSSAAFEEEENGGFSFDEPVATPAEARQRMVTMACGR